MVRKNGGRRRGTSDIVSAMLKDAINGSRKTHIMRQADMNYDQLKRYMKYTLENQLIRFDPNTSLYQITEKGKQFLDAFNRHHQAEDDLQTIFHPKS